VTHLKYTQPVGLRAQHGHYDPDCSAKSLASMGWSRGPPFTAQDVNTVRKEGLMNMHETTVKQQKEQRA
jgi:hypothetical protein